jgi:hypothetical protein
MSGGTPSTGGLVVTHHVRVDPSRSMKSVTEDVQSLLEEYGEASRRSCALLASELIAQIVGREPRWAGGPVDLTIQLREESVRMEATAPTTTVIHHNGGSSEDLAEWGEFLLDKLADRWGVQEAPHRDIWAEVDA